MKAILLKIAGEDRIIEILLKLLRGIETNSFWKGADEQTLGWNATIKTAAQSQSLKKLGGRVGCSIYPVWIPPKKSRVYRLGGKKGTYYSLLVMNGGAEFFLRQTKDVVGRGDGHGLIHLTSKLPSYVIDGAMVELMGRLDDKLRKFLEKKG